MLAALVALVAIATATASIVQQPERFEAMLEGRNVAPEPVDTGATGAAVALLSGHTLVVAGSFTGLSSTLRDRDDDPERAGVHVHPGAADETNPYVFSLRTRLADGGRSGVFWGTLRLSDEQVAKLREGRIYLDVHTTRHEDGEIRDQLRPADDGPGR